MFELFRPKKKLCARNHVAVICGQLVPRALCSLLLSVSLARSLSLMDRHLDRGLSLCAIIAFDKSIEAMYVYPTEHFANFETHNPSSDIYKLHNAYPLPE